MRIERHAVAAERLREAAEHFAERIHGRSTCRSRRDATRTAGG